MPPHFRPPTALLNCDKNHLRWPGPFDTGFLSPQPPGVVGAGPVVEELIRDWDQRELVLFFFGWLVACLKDQPRSSASPKKDTTSGCFLPSRCEWGVWKRPPNAATY